MSRYYYSKDGRDIQGPIADSDLQGMYSAGLLNDGVQICEEGSEKWQPIKVIEAPSANSRPIQANPDAGGGKYVCPRCGSSDIQSVPLIYEAGTSTSISEGRVIGVAGLGTDHLTPAGGMTTITHRQQTLLATRYSPPRLQKASNDNTALLFIALFSLIIFGILLVVVDTDSLSPQPILGTLFILAGIATLIPAVRASSVMRAKQKELTKAYEDQLMIWQQSFACQKCGYLGRLS